MMRYLMPLLAALALSCAPADDSDLADADGDGAITSVDCDDADPQVHPGAAELCNGLDDNCEGTVDEAFDLDGDGHLSEVTCPGLGDDCDDLAGEVFPGAVEVCDELDNDCDNIADEMLDGDGDGQSIAPCGWDCDDSDVSVHGAASDENAASELCDGKDNDCDGATDEHDDYDDDGYNSCVDCNDWNHGIHPGALERCNAIDDNCDGTVDEGC